LSVAKTKPVHLINKPVQIVSAGSVEFESLSDQGSFSGIQLFRFAFAHVHIAQRSRQRVDSLFETSIKSFTCFFPEVTDIVCCDDRLNVGGKPSTPGMEIQTFVSEMDFNASIYKFSEISPIFQVPSAPVDFVDDDSIAFASIQKLEHFVKDGPASFGSGFYFLKPLADL